jgi:hypothetical protein
MFLDLKSFIVACDYYVCAENAENSWHKASVAVGRIPRVCREFGLLVWTALCDVERPTGLYNRNDP